MTASVPGFGPSEELLLRILRKYFYGDSNQLFPDESDPTQPYVHTLIPNDTRFPLVLVRRDKRSGAQDRGVKDQRHAQSFAATFETFCAGVEADRDNARLQEAVRQCLFRSVQAQDGFPDLGYVNSVRSWSEPARVSDYATSTGVVQYASLPGNVVRYEAVYQFVVRPASEGRLDNPFLR